MVHKEAKVTGLLPKLVHGLLSSSPSGAIDLITCSDMSPATNVWMATLLDLKIYKNTLPLTDCFTFSCPSFPTDTKSQGFLSVSASFSTSCRSWAPQSSSRRLALVRVSLSHRCARRNWTSGWLGVRKRPGPRPQKPLSPAPGWIPWRLHQSACRENLGIKLNS